VTATSWLPICPHPPNWRVNRDGILEMFPSLDRLAGCAQDPLYHGEGDVLIHTWTACEALAGLEVFGALAPEERRIVLLRCCCTTWASRPPRAWTSTGGSRLAATAAVGPSRPGRC
jgi:hypothetical protein